MLKKSHYIEKLQDRLLKWFDHKGRDLPWRTGNKRDPYRVWLAEIMLQQTTVKAVVPYYRKFLDIYPDIEALGLAPLEEVLKHWAGLGYYSRARNLHACARIIVRDFSGRFPETEQELLSLPGIGPYTAAAISALAFNQKTTVLDSNIERVLSRLYAVTEPLPKSRPLLKNLAENLTPAERPGDFAEAMMDLGAMVCTPKAPDCPACPLEKLCRGRAEKIQETLPKKIPPQKRPVRKGYVYWLENNGKVLVRRRPEKGLLGGMPEFPTSPWKGKRPDRDEFAPLETSWTELGEIGHTFTHFHLNLKVLKASGDSASGTWFPKEAVFDIGLPTVMKKVAQKILGKK